MPEVSTSLCQIHAGHCQLGRQTILVILSLLRPAVQYSDDSLNSPLRNHLPHQYPSIVGLHISTPCTISPIIVSSPNPPTIYAIVPSGQQIEQIVKHAHSPATSVLNNPEIPVTCTCIANAFHIIATGGNPSTALHMVAKRPENVPPKPIISIS